MVRRLASLVQVEKLQEMTYPLEQAETGLAWSWRVTAAMWAIRALPTALVLVALAGISPWYWLAAAVGAVAAAALLIFAVAMAVSLAGTACLAIAAVIPSERGTQRGFAWHNNAQWYWAAKLALSRQLRWRSSS